MSTSFKPGGKISEEQSRTVPLWMAEDALADTEDDAERARIRIDIENIKMAQGWGQPDDPFEGLGATDFDRGVL